MWTAALVTDTFWTHPDSLLVPATLWFPSLYVVPHFTVSLSSIIISLVPIEHCSKDYLASILLARQGLQRWDAPRNLNPFPSTDTSIRDCLHLALGLSGHSH